MMEELSGEQIEKLKKLLASIDDSDSDDEDEIAKAIQSERDIVSKKLASTVRLLYAASKLRIYKIADKIASCEVLKEEKLLPESTEIAIPVAEAWDFRLGDKVKIKYTLRDFKSIQTRTLGWNARLHNVHGCIGIVTERSSKFENAVKIHTPTRLSTSSLYAGLLKKISPEEDDHPVRSQWKVGQYVTTKMDLKVVELMQRRLDDIPHRYLGRKGRIIAVTRVAVIVTFNEMTSYDINSYLLTLCPDQTPIQEKVRVHEGGHKVGDKVRVLSNFKKLVEKQKGKGKWNGGMSNIAGKIVTIVKIKKDGTLNVQYKHGRSWRVSADSVIKLDQIQPDQRDTDVEFVRRDIVKIKMVENIRLVLESENVPMSFLEYLRNTAEVKLIDKDFDYFIRYNCDQDVSAFASTIRKATVEEVDRHNRIKDLVKRLEVDSPVYLDVGPPNFVTALLKEENIPRQVIRAMTTQAKLVGFAEDNRAVIEYDDGRRYKVKKKFLTVPEKFNIHDAPGGLDFKTAQEIQEAVANCAQILNDDQDDPSSVKILSMAYGLPSTVDLRVNSVSATGQRICEILAQITDWNIEHCGQSVFVVSKMESHPHEIKVCLYFNEDEYQLNTAVLSSTGDVKKEAGIARESTAAKAAAAPPNLDSGRRLEVEQDDVSDLDDVSFEQFRYLRLFDPSLARNIYFPYIVHGQRRAPQAMEQWDQQGSRSKAPVYNISGGSIKNVIINQ